MEAKDYMDIAALTTSRISSEKGISFLKAIHPTANPAIIAKTLNWFEGGDLDRLDQKTKDTLRQAASGLGPMPPPPPTSPIGSEW